MEQLTLGAIWYVVLLFSRTRAELERRFQAAGVATRYYTPEIHRASFALPPYVRGMLR